MASHNRYFPPVDEIKVLKTETVTVAQAARLLQVFVDNDAAARNVCGVLIFYLKCNLFVSLLSDRKILQ
jgi:hypothetical protein